MKFRELPTKLGNLGTIVSAMACASCFPLLGSLGAALGLGVLAQFEGTFINILLPIFAVVALISAAVFWIEHKRPVRGLLSIAGPAMVLAVLYPFWTKGWSTSLLYFALTLMLAVSIWDFVSPPNKACHASKRSEHSI
jgi:mercuric ion transport protein